jgi:hypothetical protein
MFPLTDLIILDQFFVPVPLASFFLFQAMPQAHLFWLTDQLNQTKARMDDLQASLAQLGEPDTILGALVVDNLHYDYATAAQQYLFILSDINRLNPKN